MEKQVDFKDLLNRIKRIYGKSLRAIADDVGMNYSYLSDVANNRHALTDKTIGMFVQKYGYDFVYSENPVPQHYYGGQQESSTKMITLPLIPLDAVAGFPLFDNAGITISDCEQYSVPEFSVRGAEFLVRVSGSSMTPRFANGDLLACKKVAQVTFFQWGMVYVIDTQQGILVKRLYECKDDDEMVVCHSENTSEYPDFLLPKNEIRSVSIVVGHISVQ